MKIRKFILGLGMAVLLAFTLSGCDSGGSSATQNNADLNEITDADGANAGGSLFEWMVVALRGLNQRGDDLGGFSCPPGSTCFIPGDGEAQAINFFELFGVGQRPVPNAAISQPGSIGASQTPLVPSAPNGVGNGIHDVAFSPQGDLVAWVNRGRYPSNTTTVNHVIGKTGIRIIGTQAPQLPVFELQAPLDNVTGIVVDTRVGEQVGLANTAYMDIQDVSVVWSPDGNHVYFSQWETGGDALPTANFGALYVYSYNGVSQAFTQQQAIRMPRIFSDMVFSADGSYLYCLSRQDDQIFIFDRNAATGRLTARSASDPAQDPVGTVDGVRLGDVERQGRFLYVMGHESGDIEGFTINPDGSLTSLFVNTSFISAGVLGGGIDAHPSRDTLGFCDYNGNVMTANILASGQLSLNANNAGEPLRPTDTNGNSFINSGYLKWENLGNFLIVSFQGAGAGASLAGAGNPTGNLSQRIAVTPGNPFEGGLAVYRVETNGRVNNSHQQVEVENPFAIDFLLRSF